MSCSRCASRATTRSSAGGRQRRSSPTTASRARPCARRPGRLRADPARRRRRCPPPSCWRPAARRQTSPRRWRRSTWPCGTAPATARASPVSALLSDDPAPTVRVNATIAAEDRAEAAAQAAAAARAGFTCVKIKVGIGDDAGRVAAVRAAVGPEVELRLDANGAWSVEEAVRAIEALAPAGLELVEEPVHGVEALRAVRDRVAVRVAMDETARLSGSLTAKVADAVCLKVSRCGGISGLLAQAALVRASGADVYVASTFDGPLGIAAAVHCAAALRPSAASGLGTLEFFEDEFDVLSACEGGASRCRPSRASASSRAPGHRAQAAAAAADSPRCSRRALLTEGRWRPRARAAGRSTPGSSPSSWPWWLGLGRRGRRPRSSTPWGYRGAHPPLGGGLLLMRDRVRERDRKAWLCAVRRPAAGRGQATSTTKRRRRPRGPPFPSPADAVLALLPVHVSPRCSLRRAAAAVPSSRDLARRPDRRAVHRGRGDRGGRLRPGGRAHGRRAPP